MRRLAPLATALVLASSCTLVFDGRGSGGDGDGDDGGDECLLAPPATPPALTLRNPDTLGCETWTGGEPCNPECGPCPLIAPSLPPPSWGFCGSPCEARSEAECAQDLSCRVVKDAACALSGDCTTDFLGCFPTDQFTEAYLDCFAARDGQSCSRSGACTAFHRNQAGDRTFAMCAPAGKSPGTCFGEVLCARPPPGCPPDRRPGVDAGCYTGTCIPVDVCEPAPAP